MEWWLAISVSLLLFRASLSTDAPDVPDSTYTFLPPGKSCQEYRPQWNELQELHIELSFRTLTTNALLLHHTFLEVKGQHRPEPVVSLDKGVLVVHHKYGDVDEKISVAKGRRIISLYTCIM